MKNVTFAILGGDARQFSLADMLAKKGAEVRAYGLPAEKLSGEVSVLGDWREAVAGADAVVLALPASPDGIRVHIPLSTGEEIPTLKSVFAQLPRGVFLAGGRFSPSAKALAEEYGHVPFDYAASEEFQSRNALPTAEGAVSILMERISRTVSGLPVAITGFGRISHALAKLLHAMGAKVTVGARKPMALAEAAGEGYGILRLDGERSLVALCEGQAAVFNTVPHWLFTKEVLKTLKKDMLLIDLASAPGGVDVDAAGALGLCVIWALSLPGKYAPATAGEIIGECLLCEMEREGLL